MLYGNSHGKVKGYLITKPTLKKNKVGSLKQPDFKIYNKTITKKAMWHQHLNDQIDQCNISEPRNMCVHIYLDKGFLAKTLR